MHLPGNTSLKKSEDDQAPTPSGRLTLRHVTQPKDANAHGRISSGWVTLYMDQAAESLATHVAKGHVANVSMEQMVFTSPIRIGDTVSFYTHLLDIGSSSIKIAVEAWCQNTHSSEEHKVVDGTFVYVAIDDTGRIRRVPK